jgi:hypothetical protein
MIVHFKQIKGIFISDEYLVDMTSDNATLRDRVPKQISDGPLTEGLTVLSENLEGGMTAMFLGVLVINLIFSGVMNKMIGAIRSL